VMMMSGNGMEQQQSWGVLRVYRESPHTASPASSPSVAASDANAGIRAGNYSPAVGLPLLCASTLGIASYLHAALS